MTLWAPRPSLSAIVPEPTVPLEMGQSWADLGSAVPRPRPSPCACPLLARFDLQESFLSFGYNWGRWDDPIYMATNKELP